MAPLESASSMCDWIVFTAWREMTGPVVVELSVGSPSLYLALSLQVLGYCFAVELERGRV